MDNSRQNECSTPVAAGKQLSQGLKDRLKRCGRYHSSPVQSKRQCTAISNTISERTIQAKDTVVSRCLTSEGSLVSTTQTVDNDGNLTSAVSNSRINTDVNKNNNPLDSVSPFTANTGSLTDQSSHDRPCISVNKQTDHQAISKYTKDSIRGKSPSHCTKLPHSSSSAASTSDNSTTVHFSNVHTDKPQESCAETYSPNTCKIQHVQGTNTALKKHRKSDVGDSHETQLKKELAEKQETLRRLKMVKMYREKNDLTELESLISKWRNVSQEAVQDLHDSMPAPKPTMAELLDHMNIEHDFIHYNAQDESFYR